MNNTKLTIVQFNEFKSRFQKIINEAEEEAKKNEDNPEYKIDEEKFIEKYLKIQNELLCYDLSGIPFDAWDGLEILSDKEHIADFSKTGANIDFAILSFGENANFKGCNVINLNKAYNLKPSFFDEETLKKNSNIFLSDNFSNEFKNKWYSYKITIDDLAMLTIEQLNEIDSKGIDYRLSSNDIKMREVFGLIKMVDFYNLSHIDYVAVRDLLNKNFMIEEKDKLFEQLKGDSIEKIKEICYSNFRKTILSSSNSIIINNYPQQFIDENNDIFKTNVEMSEDLRCRYYNKNLTFEDIDQNYDIFKNIPIENFMSYDYRIDNIREKLGNGSFQKLYQMHPDVLRHLFELNDSDYEDYIKYLKSGKNIEELFYESVKLYFLNHDNTQIEFTDENGVKYYKLPKWMKSMNFSVVTEYETFEDMKKYNNSTLLLDEQQRNIINIFGISNIIQFENETGYFTHYDASVESNLIKLYNLEYFLRTTILDDEINFKNGNISYSKFKKEIAKCLDAMRRDKKFYYGGDYDWIEGSFRTENPEIFMDENAPTELRDAFYNSEITPNFIAKNLEYLQYLKDKKLKSCFSPKHIVVDGKITNLYDFIDQKANSETGMNLILEYRDIFDSINIFGLDFSNDDNLDSIQKKVYNELKNTLIKSHSPYPKHIPQNFIENYPLTFLNNDAPKELQEVFYNRTINSEFILSNPSFIKYLKNVDLELIYKYMPVNIEIEENKYKKVNIVSLIKQSLGNETAFDTMLLYGKYIESAFEANKLKNFKFNTNFSKNDLLNELDKNILQVIIEEKIKYDENMPSHFKKNNPTLFLNKSVSKDIRDKFYNREFILEDFNSDPNLVNVFGNTNVVCGFSENMSWMIPLFSDSDNLKMANYKRLKVISEYSKIQDVVLQNVFKEYVMELGNKIDIEKIEYVSEVLSRLSLSNSSEIFTFRKELATQILNSNNPLESLSKIEEVFIKNNLPTVGKIYSCFEILHPDFQEFNFDDYSKISPVLKKSSTTSKKIIVFADLIKASFGSNNRSVNAYLRNIEIGSNLYERIKLGQIQYDTLNEMEQKELITFSKHLATLYNNTMKSKKNTEIFISTGNILTDILELSKKLSPDETLDYNLGDRVIRMFCGFTGINTLEQAKEYINKQIKTADVRNRDSSNTEMVLEQGDFIKGIGDITYLGNILQNGSVSKEYLGSSSGSDATPLDTDVSMITSSEGSIKDKMSATAANLYGPIWFVIKNDDRFITTRNNTEELETKRDMSKMEAFYTGVLGQDHYGIRTGFASSEINYIVMENYDPRVGLEIAMNGFYIPVANKEGKIVFTPNDYDKLREKMNGLSYYNEENYLFSENLVTEETEYFAEQIEQSNYEVQIKRKKINEIIKKTLDDLGLHLKTNIDGDLTEGTVELIDTGSTGRGTNKPGDGDFDFMMRLDKNILSNPSKLNELKQTILKNLGKDNSSELTGTGDFRLKSVQIDSEINVDIDITFTEKTDKVSYSTDMALQDRLTTIQRTNPEKYKYVVANILLAKQVLKQAEVYKPNRGEIPQGGLGGVGIENWILQNGGSFIDAAKSFVEAADGKSFTEFQSSYQIWDFGDNHLAERRGQYSHDNFVSNNMSEFGYQKMVQALKEYLKSMEINQTQTEGMKR